MKLFKKVRKNNKGLSLVELVCAVAIFGVATTAIGSAMVVSAQSYSRGTYELDVQQEAQITTNLIGNLLVDSVAASYDDTTDASKPVLKIDGENITCEITFDKAQGILEYEEEDVAGNKTDGILAENVKDFTVDLSKYSDNRSAKVTLQIEKNDRVYEASYNTTSRNATAENVGINKEADIQMETEVVLEPGQSYTFPIKVAGMTAVEAGGLSSTGLTGTATGGSSLSWNGTNSITLSVADDAYDVMYFTVFTNGYKKDDAGNNTSERLDTHTVTVKIRRVNSITATHTLVSGNEYMAGAVYRVDASAIGTNLAKKLGKSYDTDYINPNYMDISFIMKDTNGNLINSSAYINVHTTQENVDAPYFQFSLIQDMPLGSSIVTTFTSKHAAGVDGAGGFYNKVSVASNLANPYATVTGEDIIEREFNGPWDPSPINRGNNDTWFNWNNLVTIVSANLGNKYVDSIKIWEVGTTEPSSWIPVQTTGSEKDVKLESGVTTMFDPDKAYNVKMKMEVFSDSTNPWTLVWPTVDTPEAEYTYKGTVGVAGITFKCDAAGVHNYVPTIGTRDNPIELNKDTQYTFKLEGIALDAGALKDNFVFTLQKWNGSLSRWEDCSDFNVQKDVGALFFNGNQTGVKYRIKVSINFPLSSYNYSSGTFSSTTVFRDLYNESSGAGIIYFKFK